MGVLNGALIATEKLGKDKGGLGGLVINVASMAGLVTGMAYKENGPAAYEISKHGVVGITKSFGHANVVRRTGIRVRTSLSIVNIRTRGGSSGVRRFVY